MRIKTASELFDCGRRPRSPMRIIGRDDKRIRKVGSDRVDFLGWERFR
jgi:hypothetical protein